MFDPDIGVEKLRKHRVVPERRSQNVLFDRRSRLLNVSHGWFDQFRTISHSAIPQIMGGASTNEEY
jgi:hypothetical protein